MTRPRRIPQPRKQGRGNNHYAVLHLNGRCHRLGRWESWEADEKYHRLIAEWAASGYSKQFGRPVRQVKLYQLIDDFVNYCMEYYGDRPNSEAWHFRDSTAYNTMLRLYGGLPIAEFGVLQFKTVRNELIERGLSRPYINSSMKRIVRLFKWAVVEERIPAAIADKLAMIPTIRFGRTKAREPEPIGPVDDRLVDATLPHLHPTVADMVRVHRLTGMRPNEVCIMRPCDIDRKVEVWRYTPSTHKTAYRGRQRVVFIGPQAQAVLLRHLVRDAESYCFSPREVTAEIRAAIHAARKTPMSCGNRPGTNRKRRPKKRLGDCYTPRSYRQAIRKAFPIAFPMPDDIAGDSQKAAQWRRQHYWAPNQLRHSAATEIRKQFGLEAAQVILGHSRLEVTQVYAERNLNLAAAVAKQVG